MKTRNRTLRFTLRALMIAIGVVAIVFGGVRYFAFPPPLMVQIEPSASHDVPVDGAFSVNGEFIATSAISACLGDYAASTLGRLRRGRVVVILPPNSEGGTFADALDKLGDATFAAGFGNMYVIRNDTRGPL